MKETDGKQGMEVELKDYAAKWPTFPSVFLSSFSCSSFICLLQCSSAILFRTAVVRVVKSGGPTALGPRWVSTLVKEIINAHFQLIRSQILHLLF